MKIYRFLWLLLLAVSSFTQTHTEVTVEDAQTITGAKTFTGTTTFSGSNFVTKNIIFNDTAAPSNYQQVRMYQDTLHSGTFNIEIDKSDGSNFVVAAQYFPWDTNPNQFNGIWQFSSPVWLFDNVGALTQNGRLNTYALPEPTVTPVITHQGAGGAGSPTYCIRAIDGNSGYSLPSACATDGTGYPVPDATHINVISYKVPFGYTNVAICRGDATCLTTVINTTGAGVLSTLSTAGCTEANPLGTFCTYNDAGASTSTWATIAGAFYANPDKNTTAQAIFSDKVWLQGGINDSGNITINALGTATSGANFGSYSTTINGTYWNGSAAASNVWTISDSPGTGANPTDNLIIGHTGTAGFSSVAVPNFQVSGQTYLNQVIEANLLISPTAPTISSGFGTSPSIPTNNGTAAFTVNVGTGGAASSGVIGLPTAGNGWICFAFDITNPATGGGYYVKQTAGTTTTATLTGYNTAGAATAWTASDILRVSCHGY